MSAEDYFDFSDAFDQEDNEHVIRRTGSHGWRTSPTGRRTWGKNSDKYVAADHARLHRPVSIPRERETEEYRKALKDWSEHAKRSSDRKHAAELAAIEKRMAAMLLNRSMQELQDLRQKIGKAEFFRYIYSGKKPDLIIDDIDEVIVDCTQEAAHKKTWYPSKGQLSLFKDLEFGHDVAMGWRHKFTPARVHSKEVSRAWASEEQDTPYTIKEQIDMATSKIKAITIGRTVSKDYQSKKCELTLEVDNDQDLEAIKKLGQAMVDTMLGTRRIARDERVKLNEFGREYFADRNFDITDLSND